MFTFQNPSYIGEVVKGLPSSFVNIYGIRSPFYGRGFFDLEDSYMNNLVMLMQNHNFEYNENFPTNITLQSIVHVKVGVLARDQQARVTFYFRIPPKISAPAEKKVQIFVHDARGQSLASSLSITPGSDWWIGTRSVLVIGDGRTSIDVYFRPCNISTDTSFNPLFFERAEVDVY